MCVLGILLISTENFQVNRRPQQNGFKNVTILSQIKGNGLPCLLEQESEIIHNEQLDMIGGNGKIATNINVYFYYNNKLL